MLALGSPLISNAVLPSFPRLSGVFPRKGQPFPQRPSRDPARADGRCQSLGNGTLPLDGPGPLASPGPWQRRRRPKAK